MNIPNRKKNSRKRRTLAAISTEYMLILAVVVLPIGLMLPFFIDMVKKYTERFAFTMRLPFP